MFHRFASSPLKAAVIAPQTGAVMSTSSLIFTVALLVCERDTLF